MVVGYSTMFNEPVTIGRLKSIANLRGDVSFEAKTVAASPILTIEATADDPRVAQDAAQHMAEAFRDDINSVRAKGNEQAVSDLQAQLDNLRATPSLDGSMNTAVAALQDRINATQFDSTNQLQDLQLREGVTEITPNLESNLILGTLAGLTLGVLAAIGLGALSTRLANSDDVRVKTGIEPLVEVPAADTRKDKKLREDRIRLLANAISLSNLTKPQVIALTDTSSHGARKLAEDLARVSAQQGNRTILVYADNQESPSGTGFNEALDSEGPVGLALKDGGAESLKILPPGSFLPDRYSRMTRGNIAAVLDVLRSSADTIFVVTPPIADTAETQLLCGAADATVLILTKGSTRARDVISAREALDKAHADVLGAVLIAESKAQHSSNNPPIEHADPVKRAATEEPTAIVELEASLPGRNGSVAY